MEAFLFVVGGSLYACIEMLWRGYTHWTMFVLGGACFVVLDLLNEFKIPWHWCLLRQSIAGACVVTVFEFVTGCIVNLWLGWNVWDYSSLPFNLLGQICIYFFLLWIPMSMAGIVLGDWIRYWRYIVVKKLCPWKQIQIREPPHYKFI